MIPSAAQVREWFRLDAHGGLWWRDNGDPAIYTRKDGAMRVRIGKCRYEAERIVWLHVTGCLPVEPLRRLDRRAFGLQPDNFVPRSGRSWLLVHGGRWQAFLGDGAARIWLGTFTTVNEAGSAVDAAQDVADLV